MADIDIDLSFSYESGEGIFSRFGLSLHKGEHLLLIASPGSGKTTFARILTGAIPKYISGDLDGHFIVDGNDVLSLDIPERLEIVGRVSQNTDEMLLFSSVEEEISFPLENLGLEAEEIQKRISYALDLFGLGRYRNVSTSELSGGEKRRLMLAILFAVNPEIYILDEAFDELFLSFFSRKTTESFKFLLFECLHLVELCLFLFNDSHLCFQIFLYAVVFSFLSLYVFVALVERQFSLLKSVFHLLKFLVPY